MLLILLYAYWNTLWLRVVPAWDDERYSHGYLIPLFTIVLLYLRYEPLGVVTSAARWTGAAVIVAASLFRLLSAYYAIPWFDMLSLLPCLIGITLIFGGWGLCRWAAAPIAFLFFMFPLPTIMDRMLLNPLQQLATVCSTFAIETIGIAAFRDGNRITLSESNTPLNVAEACSGLRMLTIFLAMSVAIVMITNRPRWERIVIILSAIPIALLVNITRISVTAVLYELTTKELAEKVFHDWAGYMMMPIALGLLFLEMEILSRLFIRDETDTPLTLTSATPA
jgi:exosortase